MARPHPVLLTIALLAATIVHTAAWPTPHTIVETTAAPSSYSTTPAPSTASLTTPNAIPTHSFEPRIIVAPTTRTSTPHHLNRDLGTTSSDTLSASFSPAPSFIMPDNAETRYMLGFGSWTDTALWVLTLYSFASVILLVWMWCVGWLDRWFGPTNRVWGLGRAETLRREWLRGAARASWYGSDGGFVDPDGGIERMERMDWELRRWGII